MHRRITFEMMGGNVDERILRVGDYCDERIIQCIVGTFNEIDGLEEKPTDGQGFVIQNEWAISDYWIGDKRLFQTFYRENRTEPWQYAGLCERGKYKNLHPRTARRIFLISQFHGDTIAEENFNVNFAQAIAIKIYRGGDIPIVPHLYFPTFLHDEGLEREFGIEAGHLWMNECDAAILATIDGRISEGMRADLDYAADKLALPIYKVGYAYTRREAEDIIRMEHEEYERNGDKHR